MACKFLPSDRKFDDYGHSLSIQELFYNNMIISIY